mmetsp:Transcript_5074/g.13081  ORF Transcript_5074/g.13081 Transcript_5074/m.13081 type:complete len:201 (-) Transcript_5074:65-667(-)
MYQGAPRSPTTPRARASSAAMSSEESETSWARMFSAACGALVVPGIGSTSTPSSAALCRTQANERVAGVTPLASASPATTFTSFWLASRLSPWKRGCPARKVPPMVSAVAAPASKLRLRGEYATRTMPSSAQTGMMSFSSSRVSSDHSYCAAANGITACALRRFSGLASEMPTARTLPEAISGFMDSKNSSGPWGGSRWR